jgi:tripartite-type tricarboxylate transporter receptor subunit TctC
MFGYIATHAMNPALQKLRYDPVADFEPVGLVGYSPTLMVASAATA